MISVKNLSKIYKSPVKGKNFIADLFKRQYKSFTALDTISFEIEADELIGFIGPNGAGKTTTMKILSGILYPTSGDVKVLGYVPFEKNHAFLKQIAFLMGQKNQLLWDLPPLDSFKLNASIYEIPQDIYKKTLSELIELLDADSFIRQPVKTLSLGQRMRAELIAALLHKPKLLFLDEPTIGLDIFAQTAIIQFIKEYQTKYHSSIVLTSHYMQDVQRLAKRVIMIDHGHVIFDGKFRDLLHTYSQEKTITIVLDSPIDKDLKMPEGITYEYLFPQIKVRLQKKDLNQYLPLILQQIEFADLLIEDEPIEEVIKKIFKKQ